MSNNKPEHTMNGSSFPYGPFPGRQAEKPFGDHFTVLNGLLASPLSDFQLPDTNFNDIFSEFDLTSNDLHCFQRPAEDIASTQSHNGLSHSHETFLPSTSVNSNTRHSQPEIDQILSTDALKLLIEQHQSQQMTPHLLSFTPPSQAPIPTAMRLSLPIPIPLPEQIKRPEPIPVTFEQFQALLSSRVNTSTAPTHRMESSSLVGNHTPRKTVHRTSENSDDQHEDETSRVGSRRHSSHNAIEKRYRSSINEKILELKEIVAANDEKIQKSGILRRAVEFIRQLQSTNERLEEENSTLKNILKRFNLTNRESTSPPTNTHPSSKHSTSDISSSTFTSDSNESIAASNDETYNPAPKRQKRTKSKPGMVNGSRLVLCAFMLCILVTNPFNYLLDFLQTSNNDNHLSEMQSAISSRTLQAVTDDDNSNAAVFLSLSWKNVIGWMLNMAICFVCLVKLFVHGDPIVHESTMDEFHLLKKKADQLMNEGQLKEAGRYYRQCCEKLYVSIDDTPMYYLFSLTWQSIRLLLNMIFVGRWLTYWSGWTKSIDTRNYNRELNFCLVQLWKIDYHCSGSSVNLMNFLLSTINTSINTGKKLDMTTRNEIVLLTALTLKKFDGLWSIGIPYVLKYLVPIQSEDIWLLDLDRLNQFIIDKPIDLFKEKRLLASVRTQYLQYLLYDDVHNQLLFEDEPHTSIRNDLHLDHYSWWQHSLQVLRCITHEKQNLNQITSTDQLRLGESSEPTIYQTARAQHIVDERYVLIIETIHRILLILTEGDGVESTNSTRIVLLKHLGQASRVLTAMMQSNWNHEPKHLELAINTLLFDGILSLRLRLLTSSLPENQQAMPCLEDFRRELNHYQQLSQLMKLPKQRSYLFEAIFRALSGLNPLVTQTLFECALKRSDSKLEQKNEPNLDIIAALLLFCHFLPSTIFRYRDLLQQAVAIPSSTKKNQDLHRLQQQCLTLIRQPYLTL